MSAREILVQRLEADLIGPAAPDERMPDRPSDRYLTGILYPQRYPFGPEEDDELASQDDDSETSGSAAEEETVGLVHAMRPATAGISFAVSAQDAEHDPEVVLRISCGTYTAVDPEEEPGTDEDGRAVRGRRPEWQRRHHDIQLPPVRLHTGTPPSLPLDEYGLPRMSVFFRTSQWSGGRLVTIALVNQHEIGEEDRRRDIEEKTFFQTRLEVRPGAGTEIRSRPSIRGGNDDDTRAAALLYRDAREFAVGHTCSAGWVSDDGQTASSIFTSWVPRAIVPHTSSRGHGAFDQLRRRDDGLDPLSAEWLSGADPGALHDGLLLLAGAYRAWMDEQNGRVGELPEHLRDQARQHLAECGAVEARMRDGVALIAADQRVRTAFQLANRAILLQRGWLHPDEPAFTWRPFQLGFLLLSLPSLADPEDPDRDVMDLLWFPTGGGKTEAYLSLIAFTLFHRRLRFPDAPARGAGVAVIMRYTLRLLTAQQFQRAAALVLACEHLRRGNALPAGVDPVGFGRIPFSIGLWVGRDATPNTVEKAAEALLQGRPNSPAQLENCPACGTRLHWYAMRDLSAVRVTCDNRGCPLGAVEQHLPIWTVDEDVYREAPSLIIGTADKFAQIVRQPATARLFGRGTGHIPPELIIQDELHLISGPLGTMAGAYEVAIDTLCSEGGRRPKIIGSTATIRRAESQIRALFDRRTRQFPPPGIDAADSGFAVPDLAAPGRLYLGVTTAGRSAKFTLQAVSASLLQSATAPGISREERDAYWTLVAYFNSLRELGGALVLMQDDVGASVEELASRRGERPRNVSIIDELTSRVSQIEIRDKLEELKRGCSDPGAIHVLLATNMISVGVDVPRLGLMVVNGQPKGIAEYIQATSRVGRGGVPGLIVTVYNNAKARDRSHYETFATWHSTLYREVEATSVTPFASRARDRALHAPLVAMVRHLEASMQRPVLTPAGEQAAREHAEAIISRAERVDPEEAPAVRRHLERLIDEWRSRAPVQRYWDDRRINTSLLISAEKAAALRAAGRLPGAAWATPNSLRNVDPATPFLVVERLRPDTEVADAEA